MTKQRLQEILNATLKRTDNTDAWLIDAMKIAVNEALDEAVENAEVYIGYSDKAFVSKKSILDLKITD